jgi:fatty-acyl-CoA synthase
MALVVLQPGAGFEPAAYYSFAENALPPYARPAFVRVAPGMDVTGTLKHTKTRLQEEGYDPRLVSDPLYFRDDTERRYTALDAEAKRRIDSGEIQL